MQLGGVSAYGVPGAAAGSFLAGLPAFFGSYGTLTWWAIAFLVGFIVFFCIAAFVSAWRPY